MPLVAPHTIYSALSTAEGEQAPDHVPPAASPERSALRSSLYDVLDRRRSDRRFADRPVPVDLLAFVCDAGIAVERAQFSRRVHGDLGLGIAVAAYDVTGLPAGLYRYSPGGDLTRIASPDRLDVLRTTYAEAPVLVLVFGDLHRAREVSPGAGYQRLLVRAGALGYGSLLAGISAGLCGCPYGRGSGIVTQLVRAGCVGGYPHHLFTLALGLPAAQDADDAEGCGHGHHEEYDR